MTGLGAAACSLLSPPIYLPAFIISSQSKSYSTKVVVIDKNIFFTQ